MSQESLDDPIKFRAGPLKEAATNLDSVHLGVINIIELARKGQTQMLQRPMTDNDKIAIYKRYSVGNLSEGAARVLLGDELDLLEEDIDTLREATEDDTTDYLV
jgi:hypothetical protein